MNVLEAGTVMTGLATLVTATIAVIKIIKRKSVKETNKKVLGNRWLTILVMILGISAVCLAIVPRIISSSSPLIIGITSPKIGDRVPQEIRVEGYATKKLPEDKYLYIVVQWKYLWWPQQGSNVSPVYSQVNKRWEFSIPVVIGQENETGEICDVLAILVDKAIHAYIRSWNERGKVKEEYPGINKIEIVSWGELEIYHKIIVIRE